MVSVILGLLAVICGGALYPVSKQSHTLGLIVGAAAIVFGILGFVLSRQVVATTDKDRTNKKEGMWLSIAGIILAVIVGCIVFLVK